MFVRSVPRVLLLLLLLSGAATAGAQGEARFDSPESREHFFKDLVRARSRAIDSAFPGFADVAQFRLKITASIKCSGVPTHLACYEAAQDTLTFERKVLYGLDSRLIRIADDYWIFYEHRDLGTAFPIVQVIDSALWSAFMNEIAQKYDATWPHESCRSIRLANRLGCEMLVFGIDSHLRLKHSRIYNANRIDRLWPENLTAIEQRAWRSDDFEYGEVRELGGIELLQPLIREFGATRVFAYVAQTPFSIEDNNVKSSALRYQEQARSALDW